MEIIPKTTRKISGWQNIAFYPSLALLMVVVLGYLTLIYFENKALVTVQDLEEKIYEVGTYEEKIQEAEIFKQKRTIDDFAILLKEHQKPSGFFKFLEEISHPKSWFSELNLKLDEFKLTIHGQAPNFQVLGQQLSIFQAQDLIQDVNLSNLSLNKEGGTDFTFELSLDSQIFK